MKLLSGDLDGFTRICREAASVKGRLLDLLEIGWAYGLAQADKEGPEGEERAEELRARLGLEAEPPAGQPGRAASMEAGKVAP